MNDPADPPPGLRYVLDPGARRLDGGRVLLAGSPLRLFRLTDAGARHLTDLERGACTGESPAIRRFMTRLVDAGAVHPCPEPGQGPWTAADVTVIIPAFGADVSALVAGLPAGVARIVVVDDASEPPLPAVPGADLLRRPTNGGPGAARATGLATVRTPLVAFVDADTEPQPGWLDLLVAHLADPAVGLVAPRVVAPPAAGAGILARYDAARSPLDLGPLPARVRARTRVAYVPAAAVLARVEALAAVGGFDETLRVGEDVDLVWRLDEVGWCVRYEPRAVVHHAVRPAARAWLAQRASYGRSAAPLARRHPGALAPAAVSSWSLAAWAAVAAGWPAAGLAVTATAAGLLTRKLHDLDHPLTASARLAGLGTLFAGRQLASAITRTWWPLAAAAALTSRRARRVVLAAAVVPALLDWWSTRPLLDPVRYTGLRVVDDLAYGTGVWQGVVAEGTMAPLVPDLTSWPRRDRYDRRYDRRREAAP